MKVKVTLSGVSEEEFDTVWCFKKNQMQNNDSSF